MADLETTIETAAGKPLKMTGDAGSKENHPLPDLVEADRYLQQKAAAGLGHLGLRFVKQKPPGAFD